MLEKIAAAGVVGAGGAGFPAHIKLDCQVEYLLVNAAECEPLLQTDKYLMRNFAHEIIEATEAVAEQVSADKDKVFVAVKGVNENEIAALESAVAMRGSFVRIFRLGNYYPAGDEQMIVFDVTGRTVPPGGIPLNVNTVVANSATMLTIYDALKDTPVTHKYLTVTGLVKNPMVLRVPVGISFKECIDACGGSTVSSFKVVNGGPMMGSVSDDSEIENLFVTKTTSGIILVPKTGNQIARNAELTVEKIKNRAKTACIQCNFCTELCPRYLVGHKLRPHMVMRQMSMLKSGEDPSPDNPIVKEAMLCCECGVCENFACPMELSPRQINMYVKKVMAGKKFEQEMTKPSDFREYRKITPSKIMARMGLSELYKNKADKFMELGTDIVNIPVKQHIGAPADSIVQAGDFVQAGQMIAKANKQPGSNIHASISGTVESVSDIIRIKGVN